MSKTLFVIQAIRSQMSCSKEKEETKQDGERFLSSKHFGRSYLARRKRKPSSYVEDALRNPSNSVPVIANAKP